MRGIVIFGGGAGIGLGVARRAAAAGDPVVIADADPDAGRLPDVADGTCGFARCDATDPEQVRRVLAEIAGRPGGLGAVVSTVGGARLRTDLATDLDYWSREIAVNLTSAYVVATTAIGFMRDCGGGSVVITASSFAVAPGPDRIAYSAAKAGVIGLTRSLAAATARMEVRVNCVAPGLTDTPRVRAMMAGAGDFATLADAKPQGRVATADEVAQAYLFLISDAARSITGQVLHVNNGSLMA